MGVRDKFTDDFLQAFHEDFSVHGKEVIESLRRTDRMQYLRIAASLVAKTPHEEPKDPQSRHDALSDEELDRHIEALQAEVAQQSAQRTGPKTYAAAARQAKAEKSALQDMSGEPAEGDSAAGSDPGPADGHPKA